MIEENVYIIDDSQTFSFFRNVCLLDLIAAVNIEIDGLVGLEKLLVNYSTRVLPDTDHYFFEMQSLVQGGFWCLPCCAPLSFPNNVIIK